MGRFRDPEQIAGFYLLECADLDEALGWAAKVPTAAFGYGAVESGHRIDHTQAMGWYRSWWLRLRRRRRQRAPTGWLG